MIQLEVTRERDIASFYADLKKYQLQIAALKRQLRNVGNYSTNLVPPRTALSLPPLPGGLIGPLRSRRNALLLERRWSVREDG